MSLADPSGNAQRDRLAELEEQMLYLGEVPDSIRYLESRVEEISEKAGTIDAVAGRVEGLPIQELLARVDTLEANTNVRRTVNYERGDSSSGFVAHMEERVGELDSSQKTLLKLINGMSEDFPVTLDVVRNEIADVNARLNLTMRAMANQAPAGGAISVSRVKIPKLKPFCGARDAKVPIHGHIGRALHNRYLGRPEERTPLAILSRECGNPCSMKIARSNTHWQDSGVRLKPWAKAKLYEQRAQDLTSAYAAAERLFDLTSDSQDVRRHQSSSLGRNRNSRLSSPQSCRGRRMS
ncbi:uncharacterized protein E5676_scaffold244G00280 [Cucumis melo var. makuwa]|uniref:Uncharacterized protein n=1 Tax=Cucumis melo var. makuwa TaxID=1194695 RepID=A0A5D3DU93_CUCMM|nr:uncharacterized protein E5676_scaffold244G00280 [Cucumis melo var. makuwa]